MANLGNRYHFASDFSPRRPSHDTPSAWEGTAFPGRHGSENGEVPLAIHRVGRTPP
jgi:hypothetical protein